jgi:LEA14-like dessication related protein
MTRLLRSSCLLGATWLALTGCASLFAKPEVRSVSFTVTRLDLKKLGLTVGVQVANDSATTVTIAEYAYQLDIKGEPFLKGASDHSIELAPQSVTTIQIPVSLPLADLLTRLKGTGPDSDLSYRFSGSLNVETMVGVRTFSFQKDGNLRSLLR